MTQAIATPQASPAPTVTIVRAVLAIVAAALLLTAFATGRATAPDDVVRTVVTVPASDDGAASTIECPPIRPPAC